MVKFGIYMIYVRILYLSSLEKNYIYIKWGGIHKIMIQANKKSNKRKQRKQRKQQILILCVFIIIGGVLGAKLISQDKQKNVQIANNSTSQNGISTNTENNNDVNEKKIII